MKKEKQSNVVTLRLPDQLASKLDNYAKQNKLTRSEVVREFIERGLNNAWDVEYAPIYGKMLNQVKEQLNDEIYRTIQIEIGDTELRLRNEIRNLGDKVDVLLDTLYVYVPESYEGEDAINEIENSE